MQKTVPALAEAQQVLEQYMGTVTEQELAEAVAQQLEALHILAHAYCSATCIYS